MAGPGKAAACPAQGRQPPLQRHSRWGDAGPRTGPLHAHSVRPSWPGRPLPWPSRQTDAQKRKQKKEEKRLAHGRSATGLRLPGH